MVCPFSLSRPGGVQGQATGLARALQSRGHQVTLFAPLDDGEGPPDLELVSTGTSAALPANGSKAPVSLSLPAVLRARRVLTSGGYDVVHVHEPFAPGLPYGLLVGGGIPPLVATFHRSGASAFYNLLRVPARTVARRFAVRCAVSESASTTAEHAIGGTYELAFNGVELDRYDGVDPWPTDRPVVLFLGRHEERKGLPVLLEAFSRLAAEGADAGDAAGRPVLWVAGDGPQTAALRDRYPGSDDVVWLGVLSEEEKVRRLTAATVLCAPSLGGESFGMVLVEAMAAGSVVVASDIDGYRQAAGGHAVLVHPDDPEALATTLRSVLDGRAAVPRTTWLRQAGEHAAGWSMDHLAVWYEPRYQRAVVGDGPATAVHCSDHE
jgi:phosphatidylinositol alpha-mannosyltransferase